MFLLSFKNEDKDRTVSLDDVALDFENENFNVEKIVKDGKTQMIKLDLDAGVKNVTEFIEKIIKDANEKRQESRKSSLLQRRKRKLLDMLKGNKGSGGGCNGGCGGGNYYPRKNFQSYITSIDIEEILMINSMIFSSSAANLRGTRLHRWRWSPSWRRRRRRRISTQPVQRLRIIIDSIICSKQTALPTCVSIEREVKIM